VRLILASASPRRQELLSRAGLSFDVIPSSYEEDLSLNMPPMELAMYLAHGKAREVAARYPDVVVIGADTFIVHEGDILGKPSGEDDAREMLGALSGKAHEVITGYTVIHGDKVVSQSVSTKVVFRQLSDDEINEYVATGEPMGKAGAYAIQGMGEKLVERIEGSLDNVIGLPVNEVMEVLRKFGISVD
jgi:septum formation protein